MKKIDLGQTIGILANIGVIAGIAFLALELRQNNQNLEMQSYQAWVDANIQLNMTLADPAQSELVERGNQDPTDLDEHSWIAFAMYYQGVFQMAQTVDYLYRSGSLDRELWEAEMDRAAGILSLPGVRQWWDAGAKTQLTPRFARFLESIETSTVGYDWSQDRGFYPMGDEP